MRVTTHPEISHKGNRVMVMISHEGNDPSKRFHKPTHLEVSL